MKTIFKNKLSLILAIVAVVVLPFHFAHADAASTILKLTGIGDILFGGVLQFFASAFYVVMTVASFGLALCGAALNVAIYLTTNLGMFINNTPAIYQVWAILRDISSMFLIFIILYAAVQTILGIQNANYANLLKNIIVVGILINFSFFFTRVLIDASNIVSLQLYNAIAPQVTSADCTANTTTPNAGVSSYLTCKIGAIIGNPQGGLADVIVQSLDVNQWYAAKNQLKKTATDTSAPDATLTAFRVLIINSAAIVVLILAALSFVGAAAASIWRICVLLVLLVVSPLWIVGYAIPQIKSEVSDKWVKHLRANLIFLPVYLLLMYVAMKIITTLNLAALGSQAAAGNILGDTWYVAYLQLFAGFAIIVVLVNLPLFTAISLSGAGDMVLGKFSKYARGWVARNTVGRVGNSVDKYLAQTRLGNSLLGRDIRSVTTARLASNKFDTALSYTDKLKELKDVKKVSKEIGRRNKLESLSGGIATRASRGIGYSGAPSYQEYKEALGKMKESEILALDPKILSNIDVAKNLKKSHYDAIKKSENISDDDKKEIMDARKKALKDAISKGESEPLKNMMKEYDPEKFNDLDDSELSNDAFVAHLTESQMRKMKEEGLSATAQHDIADAIMKWTSRGTGGKTHKAFGYVNKHKDEWGILP